MEKAKQLPSGTWRIRVYVRKEADGKKVYKTFTASSKAEVELKAAQFANSPDRVSPDNITVKDAIERYIEGNEAELSPSTVRGYIKDLRALQPLHHIKIKKLRSHDIQMYIKEQQLDGKSPKSITNRCSLLKKALKYNHIDVTQFDIKLPKVKIKKGYAPASEDVAKLYEAANRKMKICIFLAAKHSLRRGEIPALTYGDLEGNRLHIHADIVQDKDNKWIYKDHPKTDESNRFVYLSDEELKLIGTGFPNQPIVDIVPSSIGTSYYNLKKKLGLMHIRFHDFRVYFASASAAANIPERYAASMGGWKEGSTVLRDHYRKPIKTMEEKYAMKLNQKMDEYFNGIENIG